MLPFIFAQRFRGVSEARLPPEVEKEEEQEKVTQSRLQRLLQIRQLIRRQEHARRQEIGEQPGGAGGFVGAFAGSAGRRRDAAALGGIFVRRDETLETAAWVHWAARMAASENAWMCATSCSMVGG